MADYERYGLSWSPVQQGHIISAGEDDFVAHWSVSWKYDLSYTDTEQGHKRVHKEGHYIGTSAQVSRTHGTDQRKLVALHNTNFC